MDSPLEIVIDIIIAIVTILIFPVLFFMQKHEALTQTYVKIKTEELVQEIRSKGYIDKGMYDNYIEELSSTGVLYDISMEHMYQALEPEYRFRTPEEIMEDQDRKYTGENVYHDYPIDSEIPHVEDPIDNSGLKMNDETNESILDGAVRTPANPEHVHTNDCYAGHVHSGSKSFTHMHKHTSSCVNYLSRADAYVTCRNCGEQYVWTNAEYYWNTATNKHTLIYTDVSGSKNCIECGSANLQVTLKNNYSYSCYYNIDEDNDGYYDTVPIGVEKLYPGQSGPQSEEMATYTDGCYQFHKTKFLSDQFEYHESGVLKTSSVKKAFNRLKADKFQGYCTIPQRYYVGLTGASKEGEIDEDPSIAYILYEAYKASDGSMRFKFRSYWVYIPSENNLYGTENPGFPDNMTAEEFSSILYASTINNLIKDVLNYDIFKHYVETPKLHIRWFETEYKDGRRYTPYVDACSFDHSLGTNRWVSICGQEEDNTIVCNKKVISLQPTHPIQAVYVGEPLITTANATYLDGSTDIVLCNTSFIPNTPIANKEVILTYTDQLGNVFICKITVTVVPKMKTCDNGHDYNLNVDGSNPGCPFCKAWLKDLQLYYPQTPNINIFRGTTLQENGVTLLATYLDGHTEYVTTDYIDNLDKYYVGIQEVTIGYKGKYVSLTVTTKRNITLCPICNRYYELYPDDTDPGCPYCAAKTPIFTGNILEYESKYYETDILKKLYEDNDIYYFSYGDYFNITIKNRSKVSGGNILNILFRNIRNEYFCVVNGGYIREEIKRYR